MSGETYVYRLRALRGDLLYVGITSNLARRLGEHSKSQPWWGDVNRIDFTLCCCREDAEVEEALAIKAEGPEYNIAGRSGGWDDLVSQYPFLEEWETDLQLDPTPAHWLNVMDHLEAAFEPGDEWHIAQTRLTSAYVASYPGPFA